MKKLIIAIAICLLSVVGVHAQSSKNNTGDSILGNYEAVQGGEAFKVRFTKKTDGTYKAQIYWLEQPNDPKTGKPKLDSKNPDKSKRTQPSSQAVLIDGLKYNAEKKQWDGAKIYDPQRGLTANVTATFQSDGRLMLKGTIMGIGEKVFWTPCK